MCAGFILEAAALGGVTCDGREPVGGARWRRTSRSSRSESRSEMSPSAGSLSSSLSLTSSIRACDIMIVLEVEVEEEERSLQSSGVDLVGCGGGINCRGSEW